MKYKHIDGYTLIEIGPLLYRRVDQLSILTGPFGLRYRRVGRHFVLQISDRVVFKWPMTLELSK